MNVPGIEKAWEILKRLDSTVVCKNASVRFDEKTGCYILRSFCTDFSINSREKVIKSSTSSGESIINKYSYFFISSCLWYLINAKDISLTGRLMKPDNLKGGDLFFRGSHVLPLDRIAAKFQNNKEAFLKIGEEICGKTLNYGDASIQVNPMPKIPVILILWIKDEEFPARINLLLDSSCEFQLPLDIIWSISMLSVLIML